MMKQIHAVCIVFYRCLSLFFFFHHGLTEHTRPDLDKLKEELTQLGATHVVTDEELGSHTMRSQMKDWFAGKPPLLGLNCVGGKSATEMARYLG